MTKDKTPAEGKPLTPASRIKSEVAALLGEIEKEDIPERLLKSAQDLQKAMNAKRLDES